jgi:CBS domain-containing membrane protein
MNILADTNENEKHPVSEEIRRMTMPPASSAGEISSPKEHQELKTTNTYLAIYAKDIMQKDVLWGTEDDDVQQTLTKIKQHGTGYVMIGQDKIPQGIVSKSDLTAALSPYLRPEFAKWRKPSDDASLKIRIKWIMSSPVNTINLETPLAEIMENMCQSGRRALPVVDQQGKVQGMITVFDIFKGLLKHFSHG